MKTVEFSVWRRAFALAVLTLIASGPVRAQSGTTLAPGPDPAALARGWTALSAGDVAAAVNTAAELSARYPRSAAALGLRIEAELVRAGAVAALTTYEQWLGSRTVEDAYALRRIAHTLLREDVARQRDRGVQVTAEEALVLEGDRDARSLSRAPGAPDPASANQNVEVLLQQLQAPGPLKRRAIVELGHSRSQHAVAPLIEALHDPDATIRSAAADALGSLGSEAAIAPLNRLLRDSVFDVRFAAAKALIALDDAAAAAWMEPLLQDETPAIRVAAAKALRRQASASWLATVRELAASPDPDIRRQGAELLAPHDPALARSVLEQLLSDPNPAERQAAGEALARSSVDVTALRRLLRDADPMVRVGAASRLLEITR